MSELRQLDVDVHTRVMGRESRWSAVMYGDWMDGSAGRDDVRVPRYSRDIAAAMSVVEVLRKRFYMVDVGWSHDDNVQPQCRVFGESRIIANESGATAAEAICRAALTAIRDE